MAGRDRPVEIRRFEQLWLIAVALDIGSLLRLYAEPQIGALRSVGIGSALGVGITILLVLLISRGAISVVRIVLTGWLLVGLLLIVAGMALLGNGFTQNYPPARFAMIAATAALKLAALYHVWTPAASRWLAEKR